ncbi:MAG TPA: acireductone synthase [Vicinamibacterales bacterium]|nr:acireductone synthase [Vicinamibacterales bacterium]
MRAILLDIEGTTTPVAFVYQTLFPYARRRLRDYLTRHAQSADLQALAERLKRERDAEPPTADLPAWNEATAESREQSMAAYAAWLMERDRKSPALKELQGRIWEEGYAAGDLAGEVYDDVASALRRWRRAGLRVGIFSSGSVLAQKLLFGRSTAGDLTPLIDWHFDTSLGAKTDRASYERIASAVGVAPAEILFISDAVPELDAARGAGMHTALCLRPGNAPPPAAHAHRSILNFDELAF